MKPNQWNDEAWTFNSTSAIIQESTDEVTASRAALTHILAKYDGALRFNNEPSLN